jgi:Alcohol dehydrogenase GroES-associated
MQAVVFAGTRQVAVQDVPDAAGPARPGAIVSHHGRLADAPELYRSFDRRADGVIKAVLNPQAG